jgi:hypothetical protein
MCPHTPFSRGTDLNFTLLWGHLTHTPFSRGTDLNFTLLWGHLTHTPLSWNGLEFHPLS